MEYCCCSVIIFGYFPNYGIAPAGPPGMFQVLHLIIERAANFTTVWRNNTQHSTQNRMQTDSPVWCVSWGKSGGAKIWKNENILQAVSLIRTLAVPLGAVGNMVCCVSGDQSDHQSNVSIFPPSGGRQTVYYGGAANVIKSISGGHSHG